MTDNEKLVLLYIINKTQDALQYAIAQEDKISDNDAIAYFKIKSDLQGLIQEYIKEVESKGCEVVWEDNQAIKIIEKGEKELCDDYVKREDVIQHICESQECYKADCKGRLYKRCWDLEWIYELPTVKFTRKAEKRNEELNLKKKGFYENLQEEGLAILKLHERLEKENINHIFIDRKYEMMKRVDHEVLEDIKEKVPFDFQILIEEKGFQIMLTQHPFSYGITNNLIEVYNFNQEPITLWYTDAFKFIKHKCLDEYICYVNKLNADTGEDSKQMREEFHKFIKTVMESEEN